MIWPMLRTSGLQHAMDDELCTVRHSAPADTIPIVMYAYHVLDKLERSRVCSAYCFGYLTTEGSQTSHQHTHYIIRYRWFCLSALWYFKKKKFKNMHMHTYFEVQRKTYPAKFAHQQTVQRDTGCQWTPLLFSPSMWSLWPQVVDCNGQVVLYSAPSEQRVPGNKYMYTIVISVQAL